MWAAKNHIKDSRVKAPVFDFFMPGCKEIDGNPDGSPIVTVIVIPYKGSKPFVQLNEKSQKAYLKPEVWANVLMKKTEGLEDVSGRIAMK